MIYAEYLKTIGACQEVINDAQGKTAQQIWDTCERGDWMLWLIGKLSSESGSEKRKQLVLTACKCARLALKYIPNDEKRPLRAIETAEQWANGENGITLDEVRNAAHAAYAAAHVAYAAAGAAADAAAGAAHAAYAAAHVAYAAAGAAADAAAGAAYAAYAVAAAAAYVAYAADAAAHAAYAAADAARKQISKQCADIVRADYPVSPAIEIIGEN